MKKAEELDQLRVQEQLPTPDIVGKKYVQPDYSITNPNGQVVAYADAKSGQKIPFDRQAEGFVEWSTTTSSRTLIYYTPDGTTPIDPGLLAYASSRGVRIIQVAAP